MPTFFLISGEVSGDTHGAELIASLRGGTESAHFTGLGGPRMKGEAPDVTDWLDEAAVLGLWEVAKKYSYFSKKMDQTLEEILELKPDVLVLIDYPGFNLRLAKALRQRSYKGKIAYYISPQVWAWKRGRIKEMAKTLDLMLCIFPFEKELYEMSGLHTEFVGHPLIDELAEKRIDTKRDAHLVGLFPGSRNREVQALFPIMLETAKILHEKWPKLQFVTAAVNPSMAATL
ncbi:MAG: lipid-A-disaccharide synthase, partial [Verrucomicrobiota bacterium]